MTNFMKAGNRFNVSATGAVDIYDHLPVGTYSIKYDSFNEVFYLEKVEGFTTAPKLYGDTREVTKRILHTFDSRPNQTGVMLSGEKGSGKTLQAKDISVEAAKKGLPTIVINEAWAGEKFNTFVQMIEQPVVMIFDEFEKVYGTEDQEKLLTLFDGVYPSKKLFILTCNDRYRVDGHMSNRPGRIYYRLEYKGLNPEFIREYCEENLGDTSHIDSVCNIAALFSEFNFDMLKALVEEMNLHNETAQQAMKYLNAKPESSERTLFSVELEIGGKLARTERDWRGNPIGEKVTIYYYLDNTEDDDDYETILFNPSEFVETRDNGEKFVFVKSSGERLVLTKQAPKVINYSHL